MKNIYCASDSWYHLVDDLACLAATVLWQTKLMIEGNNNKCLTILFQNYALTLGLFLVKLSPKNKNSLAFDICFLSAEEILYLLVLSTEVPRIVYSSSP